MKKLVLAAMMAVSCTFAFADSNPVHSYPSWRVLISEEDGEAILFDDGNYCRADVLICHPNGHYSQDCWDLCSN